MTTNRSALDFLRAARKLRVTATARFNFALWRNRQSCEQAARAFEHATINPTVARLSAALDDIAQKHASLRYADATGANVVKLRDETAYEADVAQFYAQNPDARAELTEHRRQVEALLDADSGVQLLKVPASEVPDGIPTDVFAALAVMFDD